MAARLHSGKTLAHVLTPRLDEGDPRALRAVVAMIAAAEGNLSRAARGLRVSRQTLWRWTQDYPQLAAAVASARQA